MRRILVLAVMCAALYGGATAGAADKEGCKDHPLFSRMPNYELYGCAQTEFDAVAFPKPERKEWAAPEDYTDVEGKIFAVSYKLKEGATPASSLQVIRNFQNAVKKAGGLVLGDYDETLFPSLPRTAEKYLSAAPGGTQYDRYTIMTLTKGGSDFWIYLCASESYQDYMLLMVEKEEMKQVVSVGELEKQLNKDGFLTFYIKFDTAKAELKPESQDSIDQIASLLKFMAGLKVSIEGHTDNVGTPESNKKLSEERARAVMAAVVAKGIAADRMTAVGQGQDRPVADNRKDEGRALNRRVEVVKQ